MKNTYTGIQRLWAATKNSLRGLRTAFRHEAALRQDLILCAAAAAALPWIQAGKMAKVLMAFSLLFIPVAELINTAIENVIDRIGPEYHEMSKRAKDVGSAIVFATICAVAAFWVTMIAMF